MKSPIDMDDDLLEFLQSFFSTGRNLPMGNAVKTLVWRSDPNTTDILIRNKDIQNAETMTGNKPEIILDRGRMQIMYSSLKSRADRIICTNEETFLELAMMPYAIHCVDQNDYEASQIATMVAGSIWMHHDHFKPLGYHRVRVDGIGSPTILMNEKSSVVLYDVPVAMHVMMNMHFRVTKETPPVETYTLDTPVIKEIV